jgi:hypothetical protein
MLPFSNFTRIMHEITVHDEREHPAPTNGRGSIILTLIPIALAVVWAVVLLKH